MPPDPIRVAQPIGTPIMPPVSVSLDSSETLLIAFAVCVMLLLGSLFLLGVWFFLKRLKSEQDATVQREQRDPAHPGTGSRPDTPPSRRGFTPQADLLDHDP